MADKGLHKQPPACFQAWTAADSAAGDPCLPCSNAAFFTAVRLWAPNPSPVSGGKDAVGGCEGRCECSAGIESGLTLKRGEGTLEETTSMKNNLLVAVSIATLMCNELLLAQSSNSEAPDDIGLRIERVINGLLPETGFINRYAPQ